MVCTECNQNPATLHFTQIINGNKKEVNVCEACAQKEGYITNTEEAFSLHELLTGLFKATSQPNKVDFNNNDRIFDRLTDTRCEVCKLSYAEFQRIGRFGCANCYDTFKLRLNSVIRRVHNGNTQHSGKIPKRKGGKLHLKKELTIYRNYLKQLIEDENFEEAAIVRDRIKQLERDKGGSET